MIVLGLFDGSSCGQLALLRAGLSYSKYYSSEIDKAAIKITQTNFPNTIQLGDIKTINGSSLDKIDLLIGGSSCKSFSTAGNKSGFNGSSSIFWEYVRLLKETKPKHLLLENVLMKKEWANRITEALGVKPIKINSSTVSAQNRRRLYWTNIPNVSTPEEKNILLEDVVGECEGIWVYPRGNNKGGFRSVTKSPTLTTSSWQHNFFYIVNGKKKKFTPEHAEQLQTIPIGYTKCVPKTTRFKVLGNAWTVDVIAHILKHIKKDTKNDFQN